MRYILFSLIFLSVFVLQDHPITIYLAGDSTMAEKLPGKRPETGWGEFVQQFFNRDSVRVENHARNGRSTRTFIQEHRWQAILDSLKEGDYVFIQFGHNDESKQKTDRYTPPEDYRKNLLMFVRTVREKNANPILFTPVVRRRFDSLGVFYDTHGEYPDIVRAIAHENNVPLVDMQRKTRALLERYGEEESKKLFLHVLPGESPNYPEGKEDNTHFSPLGAELAARLAIDGLREVHLDLVRYFVDSPSKERRGN
jgi:pectinesterase